MFLSNLGSMYDKAKKVYDQLKPVLDDKQITKRLPRVLCIIASSILALVFIHQYCNIINYANIVHLPMFSESMRNYIGKVIFLGGIGWLTYHVVAYPLLLPMIVRIDCIKNTTYIRFLQTVDDIIDIFASGMFLVYALDELSYLTNYEDPAIKIRVLFCFAIVYLCVLFIMWVYQKNNHNPYAIFTGYCDNNRSLIREGDLVAYNNKLYWVRDASKEILGYSMKAGKDPYILLAFNQHNDKTLTLEEAAQNIEGNLTIIKQYNR